MNALSLALSLALSTGTRLFLPEKEKEPGNRVSGLEAQFFKKKEKEKVMDLQTGFQLEESLKCVAADVALEGADLSVLFISDPTNGDEFHVGPTATLPGIPIPPTATGHEITSADDLLLRLDFNAYSDGGWTEKKGGVDTRNLAKLFWPH